MLSIYNPGSDQFDHLNGCYHKNFFPYDLEKKYWKRTPNIKDAEYISIHAHDSFSEDQIYKKIELIKQLNLHPDQKLLFLHIWHLDNNWPDRQNFLFARRILQQEIPNPFAIVHTNFACNMEIQYDFLWNRQKVYFTDYNSMDLSNRIYTYDADIKNFELTKIMKLNDPYENKRKKFLSPNRVYKEFEHTRLKYRKKLIDFVQQYEYEGYYSDPQNGKVLTANNPQVDKHLKQGGWFPISNAFYMASYFSLYVETIPGSINEMYPYKSITEKTWDPLIKGHFILPFGYKGLVDHIKSYGFILPDWIDYSYDTIEDDDLRFERFLDSAEKLLDLTVEEWDNLYQKDFHMLIHNRELFWERPYDLLHDKVVNFFARY